MKYPSRTRPTLGHSELMSRQDLELESRLVASVLLAMHVSAYGAKADGSYAGNDGQNTLIDNAHLLNTAAELRRVLQLNIPANSLFTNTAQSLRAIATKDLAWLSISTELKSDCSLMAYSTP